MNMLIFFINGITLSHAGVRVKNLYRNGISLTMKLEFY